MKIIIAGNYSQYVDYLTKNNLSPLDARYVWQREDLFGLRNVEIVLVGEWWKNPCHNDEYLKIINMPIV